MAPRQGTQLWHECALLWGPRREFRAGVREDHESPPRPQPVPGATLSDSVTPPNNPEAGHDRLHLTDRETEAQSRGEGLQAGIVGEGPLPGRGLQGWALSLSTGSDT